VLLALGLNLAVLALLGGILASGTEPGGLGVRWHAWVVPFAALTAAGLLVFRFPRAVGIPAVLLAVVAVWLTVGALKEFKPLNPAAPLPTVQPLTDREMVTAFALRVDVVMPPASLPLVPHALYRWRGGDSPPAEWWWSWAQSRGWARSAGAALPTHPMKFGVYRLTLSDATPTWRLETPELQPP
jgi:hypothetical protein